MIRSQKRTRVNLEKETLNKEKMSMKSDDENTKRKPKRGCNRKSLSLPTPHSHDHFQCSHSERKTKNDQGHVFQCLRHNFPLPFPFPLFSSLSLLLPQNPPRPLLLSRSSWSDDQSGFAGQLHKKGEGRSEVE